MKTLASILVVLLSGLLGLSLVFTDWVPVPLGPTRAALGGLLYLAVGFFLARWHAGRRPLVWALAPAWALVLLGLVGLWITLTQPASGDWILVLLFLFGPVLAAVAGGLLATTTAR